MVQLLTSIYILSLNDEYRKVLDQPKWLKEALHFMELNYMRNISIAEIAAAVNMSESNLYKLFRENTQMSPHKHLLQLRLEKSRMLLADNQLSIKEISSIVGFSSPTNFIVNFKDKFGITPLEYRKTLLVS